MNSLRYLERVSSTLSLTLVAGMVNKKWQKVGEALEKRDRMTQSKVCEREKGREGHWR